jgi:undecaprenyl-diphosphatase
VTTLRVMPRQLWLQLGTRERALMLRCALPAVSSRRSRAIWIAITHLGGPGPTVLAAVLPWFAGGAWQDASIVAMLTLGLSHLIVQFIKRTVVRVRPATADICDRLIREPDPFSFPSGHSAAAMSIALTYGAAFPIGAAPLLFVALLVGFSRVRLGVHYPSDVLVGQLIAAGTAAVWFALIAH